MCEEGPERGVVVRSEVAPWVPGHLGPSCARGCESPEGQ